MSRINLLELNSYLDCDILSFGNDAHDISLAWPGRFKNIIVEQIFLILPERTVYGKKPIFSFINKGVIRCCECGIQGTHHVKYRLKSEIPNGGGVHHDVVAFTRFEKIDLITVDHILPRSLGGNNSISNLRPMCERCNGSRRHTINRYEWKKINENLGLYLAPGTRSDLFYKAKGFIDAALLTRESVTVKLQYD